MAPVSKNPKIILVLVIGLIVVLSILFLFSERQQAVNSCSDCGLDCDCLEQLSCTPPRNCLAKEPTQPQTPAEQEKELQTMDEFSKEHCGNGKCDIFENEWSCCQDCQCNSEGMECDESSNSCGFLHEPIISEEFALTALKEHLMKNGKTEEELASMVFGTNTVYHEGKYLRDSCYVIDKDYYSGGCAIIDEEGNILEEYYIR